MVTYDIFHDLVDLRSLIDDFFGDTGARYGRKEFPYIQLYEGEDELEIRAAVPGLTTGDLDLQLVDNTLVIEGEKKKDYSENPYLRRERYFGRFKKAVRLPYIVDGSSIKAELKNGMLTVRLARSEDAKPKKIEIK
ncbi:MAG: Hsp20/alpha crystallin family protein [Spirochaetes bacterium]|jgi:HSP20 family protein|nr:Hsp20/alpha crystallin family protein [Spirochaetota bacterium]